ncbi:MAG: hypothetical protein ACRDXX_19270 [Stackebrandtia sp.]
MDHDARGISCGHFRFFGGDAFGQRGDVIVCAAFESRTPPPPYGHVDLVLAQAVACNVITRDDAALITDTRLDGRTLAHAADTLGIPAAEARIARKTAESAALTDELVIDVADLEQHSRSQIEKLRAVLDRGVDDAALRELAQDLLEHRQQRLRMFADQREQLRAWRAAAAAHDSALAELPAEIS